MQAAILQVVPFFVNLTPEEAENLSRLLVVRRFSAGQIVFHHGDPGGLLYIVSKGRVKITHSTSDG
ncbi:MAG TPA: cyclic nucleotide-binding domain-containing protein, partial [Chloroflexota bacterium]|nr:cyclic nucleotide-binding domain-containing protein [Chloroflexota bacterium]